MKTRLHDTCLTSPENMLFESPFRTYFHINNQLLFTVHLNLIIKADPEGN